MALTVALTQPIVRGDQTIAEVTVRKPSAGALRGLKITSIVTLDVSSLLVLLPRITEPALLPDEVAALDLADLFGLGQEVIGFFMTPAQAEALTAAQATIG